MVPSSPGKPKIFVSYAWGHQSSESARQREEVVDALCRKLEADAWEVVRDKTHMHAGDLISEFMKGITRADRVVAVLSDKYLRSAYCMTELYGIYQRVQGEKKEFLECVVPLTLDDAKFSSWRERVAIAEHWRREFEEMRKSYQDLSVEEFKFYKAVQDWHNHVGDILAYVNDRLHPRGFEEIVKDDFAALRRMLEGKRGDAGEREEEEQYLRRLIADIEAKAKLYSPLAGIANVRSKPAGLDAWKDDPGIELLIRHQTRKRDMEAPDRGRDYDDILAAFGEVRRAALLGAPGSGKSTTLRKLALELAQRALAEPNAALPVLVNLGDWVGDEPLTAFLGERTLAQAGRLVLLLDGLNEMPTAKRAKKAAEVRELCARLEQMHARTAVVGCCRREDYVGDLDLGLDTLTLEPLSPQRIRAALRQWMAERGEASEAAERLFWQLAGDERLSGVFQTWLKAGASEEVFWTVTSPRDEKQAYAKTSGEEDQLWSEHIPNARSLLWLAANPYMLTMLFVVWLVRRELPKNRGDLFRGFVDGLLSRERLDGQDSEVLLRGLEDLAWRMQGVRLAEGRGESGDFGVLTVVPRDYALDALRSESILKKAQDSTLLEGTDELRFRHQLLQEYFTAQALLRQMHAIRAEGLWPAERWWERTGWEEAAVLLAGFYGDDCAEIVRWLAEAQPEVAAQCILESGAGLKNEKAVLAELQRAWLRRLFAGEPPARAAVGRALGRLKLDNRKGVGLRGDGVPDIDWVEIAGGEFIYQKGERRKIEVFLMARYPVTNAQFQAFLDASDGYADELWWRGLDNPDRTPQAAAWTEGNHPRETVSWYEAMAFCAWLAHKLKLDVTLPTEWQWERAARGREGREFPWGSGYVPGFANIDETSGKAGPHYLGRTSAVGIYPQGASLEGEGVLDLAGNVWEWCLNEFAKPKQIQAGGSETRVVRGGSWLSDLDFARAQYRYDYNPNFRFYVIGFRVVVRSPMKS